MPVLVRAYRISLLIALNLVFLLIGISIAALSFLKRDCLIRGRAQCMMWWARSCCFAIGIRITTSGLIGREGTFFIVSNHCSYLDILVIGSTMPSVFVSKEEVASWFAIGRLARLAGTVFVNRNSRASTFKAVAEAGERLRNGISIAVFPEGTTSNGLTVGKFKSAFFKIPAEAGTPVLPVSLRYSRINGMPVTAETSDAVAWHADMQFLPHFWRLIGLRGIDAGLYFNPVIDPGMQERKSLASRACEIIRTGHVLLGVDAGL